MWITFHNPARSTSYLHFSEVIQCVSFIFPRFLSVSAIIMEFKVRNSRKEKTLEETAEHALNQIEEMNYDAQLFARGFKKEEIRHYGFAFEGKKILIGTQE